MPSGSYVALVRAINVGGKNAIAMAGLRAMCADLGLIEPRTVLQSANLVFETSIGRARLVPLLEAETLARFGVAAAYVLRDPTEWRALIAANPFPEMAASDPSHLVVMCCTHAPAAKRCGPSARICT
jgi:uncharacterized protein (DUF1697 family)